MFPFRVFDCLLSSVVPLCCGYIICVYFYYYHLVSCSIQKVIQKHVSEILKEIRNELSREQKQSHQFVWMKISDLSTKTVHYGNFVCNNNKVKKNSWIIKRNEWKMKCVRQQSPSQYVVRRTSQTGHLICTNYLPTLLR